MLYILDPGMDHDQGHHFVWNRLLEQELNKRCVPVKFIVHKNANVQNLPNYEAYFDHRVYNDPGWNNLQHVYQQITQIFADTDMSESTIFMHTCNGIYLAALTEWYKALNPGQRPTVRVNFHRDYPLYSAHSNFIYGATSVELVQYYSQLLHTKVTLFPVAMDLGEHISTTMNSPIVFAFAGLGVDSKRVDILPCAIEKYISFGGAGNFYIQMTDQNSEPVAPVHRQFRFLSRHYPERIQYSDAHLKGTAFYAHLVRSDCVLLPYPPLHYSYGYSQVLYESIAMNLPAIVHAGTSLACAVEHAQNGSIVIQDASQDLLCDAMLQFEEEALPRRQAAFSAGARFRAFHNIFNLVDVVLGCSTGVSPTC